MGNNTGPSRFTPEKSDFPCIWEKLMPEWPGAGFAAYFEDSVHGLGLARECPRFDRPAGAGTLLQWWWWEQEEPGTGVQGGAKKGRMGQLLLDNLDVLVVDTISRISSRDTALGPQRHRAVRLR